MQTYKVELELRGPVSTPFHSGTLFGHLCWRLLEKEGEEALKEFLKGPAEFPFLISSAFPAGNLPRPLLPPRRRADPAENKLTPETVKQHQQLKKARKRSWIPVEVFLEIRGRLSEAVLLERLPPEDKAPEQLSEQRAAHNTINRLTGTTPASGGLYFMDEFWPRDGAGARFTSGGAACSATGI